jgi:short-subunit dehydrogenase
MSNQTALVTGASRGIGYEFAKILAKDCGALILVARDERKLRDVKKELEAAAPVAVLVLSKDLSKPGAAEEIFRELEERNIAVDILVNNAGFGDHGAFVETDWQREERMIAVHITALTRLTKLAVQGMVGRKRGSIVNVASTAAFQPGPFMSVYYASKAYILSFTEALANELKGTDVTVTALCPGPTATGFATTSGMADSRLFRVVKPARAADVARFGYEAMKRGKTVAIHGVLNRIMSFCVRMSPRKLVLVIVRWLHEKTG